MQRPPITYPHVSFTLLEPVSRTHISSVFLVHQTVNFLNIHINFRFYPWKTGTSRSWFDPFHKFFLHFPKGRYSVLAGFVEPGESLEEAVERELEEEVGIRVKNIKYFESQPWPFPHSLMVGFTAEWARREIRPDGKEIEDAR